MKTIGYQINLLCLLVCLLSLTVSLSVFAQQQVPISSNLRESPRQETEKIIPISRSTIQVELSLNKQCGSPFYPEEKVQIFFKTDVSGYITLYDIDTQGNVLVIFPNRHTPDNYVRAGQSLQIPAQEANYDLIVEGPEGIEYIEAVASINQYYHWNHYDGQPRWLREWNLKGRKQQDLQVQDTDTAVAYKDSPEYQNLPDGMGALGLQSVMKNFSLSQGLREQVQSKLVVRPHEDGQQPPPQQQQPQQSGGRVEPVSVDYSTATCYMYIVEQRPVSAPAPAAPAPQPPSMSSAEDYLRQQERDFQQIPDLNIQRRGERLIVELPGRILFDSGSESLRYEAQQDLTRVANILLRYPQTTIVVMGHTDSIGNSGSNQRLSEARARSVADYLVRQGVSHTRISWVGYGEDMPLVSNSTETGRQRNRRVELDIRVNQ